MVFETPRLIIRQPVWSDAEHFYTLNSDPDIMRFIRPPNTRQESDKKLKDRIATNNLGGNGLGGWAVETKSKQDYIGTIALFLLPDSDEVHLGYSLLTTYWGYGYASELAIACVQYAFNTIKLKRLVATTFPEHIISEKVLNKVGFIRIGITIDEGQLLHKYELTEEDWRLKTT